MSATRTLTCPVCGREFKTDKPRQKYCSNECRIQANLEMQKEKYAKNTEGFRARRNEYARGDYWRKKIKVCAEAHDNCFSCDTPDGECKFE